MAYDKKLAARVHALMSDRDDVGPEGLEGRALSGWVEAAIVAAESRPPSEAKVSSR
jgi:hypothetical protein